MELTFKDRDNELVFDGSAEEFQLAMYEIRELRSVRPWVRPTEIEPYSDANRGTNFDVRSLLLECPSASVPQPDIIEATAQTIPPTPALPPAKRSLPKWTVPTGFAIVFGACVGFSVLFAIHQAKRVPTPIQSPAPKTTPKPAPKSKSKPTQKLSVPVPPPPPKPGSIPQNIKVCIPLPATEPPQCK